MNETLEKPKARKQVKAETEAEEPKPKSYAAFLTRPGANEGVKFDLSLPDGTKSGFWIRIVGEDSDIFRDGHAELLRSAIKEGDSENADAAFKDPIRAMISVSEDRTHSGSRRDKVQRSRLAQLG